MRILIRVPEAYLLLPLYTVTRPGLLVIDADGRKVAFLNLVNAPRGDPSAGEVAHWLRGAGKTKPRERFRFRISGELGDDEKDFLAGLGKIEGVHSVVMKKSAVLVTADPGTLTPAKVLAPPEENGLSLSLESPVPVRFSPREKADGASAPLALDTVPGVWSVGGGERPTALVAKFLIHPEALAWSSPAWILDVESRRFSLPAAPAGHGGMRVIFPVARMEGVLALFPDLGLEGATVVARKGDVDWDGVVKTFREGGVPKAKVLE